MNDNPIRRGDVVLVSAHGQDQVRGNVIMASPNGDALLVEFPGGFFQIAGAGAYIGTMPVLRQGDGRWIELINQREVRVELAQRPFTCPRCGAVSYNPTDAAERYCGRCHVFVDD